MSKNFLYVFNNEYNVSDIVFRRVVEQRYDPDNLTTTYVTKRIKSWSNVRDFFEEQKTGLSDYLFDEIERAAQEVTYYKGKAMMSAKVSDELKVENGLLRQRIERLEQQLEQAKGNS
jgi:hypothetical protein